MNAAKKKKWKKKCFLTLSRKFGVYQCGASEYLPVGQQLQMKHNGFGLLEMAAT